MARREDKNKAIQLRKKGYSYSQIKKELGVGKSTLSVWLHDMPLSKKRLDELQRNEAVIEKIRSAKRKTREIRLHKVFSEVSRDIGKLSERDLFIAGLFLYWGEGSKTQKYTIALANTDPAMIRTFLAWLKLLKVPEEKIKVRLHLYSDMDPKKEVCYWSKEIRIPRSHFSNPYIKKSKLSDLTYITRGHGTCNVAVNGRDIAEYVHQGLKYIEALY